MFACVCWLKLEYPDPLHVHKLAVNDFNWKILVALIYFLLKRKFTLKNIQNGHRASLPGNRCTITLNLHLPLKLWQQLLNIGKWTFQVPINRCPIKIYLSKSVKFFQLLFSLCASYGPCIKLYLARKSTNWPRLKWYVYRTVDMSKSIKLFMVDRWILWINGRASSAVAWVSFLRGFHNYLVWHYWETVIDY